MPTLDGQAQRSASRVSVRSELTSIYVRVPGGISTRCAWSVRRSSAQKRRKKLAVEAMETFMLRRNCGTFLMCSPGIRGENAAPLAAALLGRRLEAAQRHYWRVLTNIPAEPRHWRSQWAWRR